MTAYASSIFTKNLRKLTFQQIQSILIMAYWTTLKMTMQPATILWNKSTVQPQWAKLEYFTKKWYE